MAENAESDLSRRLRRDGVTLGEVFSFISGLYFRGKLAYARAFSSPPSGVCGCYVITAGGGLVPPETVVNLNRLREFAVNAIDPCNERYRAPLDRDCSSLSETAGNSCEIVLLGSIATRTALAQDSEIVQFRQILSPRPIPERKVWDHFFGTFWEFFFRS